MKEGWEYIAFKDVYPIKMGKTPPRGDKSSWDEKKETHNKWVSIADISNNEGKIIEDTKEYISDSAAEKINKVSKGSLLMSFKLSIGRMAFAGDDLYTNEAIIAIPENEKYILRFIYYYLLSYDWLSLTEGNEKVKGATLNKTSIGKIQLPVLSLIEQQSIVDYLDSAFAKIDAMKANAEKALNEAKALFQASLKEMLEPKEGWESVKLINIYNFIDYRGATPKKITEGVPLVTAKNVKLGYIDYTIKDYISEEEYKQRQSRGISHKGDILFTTEAPLGNVAIADLERFSAGQRLITLQKYKDSKHEIDNRFYYYYMLGPLFQKKIQSLATGATALGIKAKILKEVEVPLPTNEDQQRIIATLDSLKSKVDRLQANYEKISQECDALKQAILRQIFE